ncbi:sulfite exporter TauE/SafE family protein [Tessaracoccus sp. SD287]|uniref:sulfite exporter TauE/SafE family protein n=1 Tax=Tessaracoccus sp. SD287 TaxID=2782008 RepID=UPI001A966C77|nr:sulfite exporter TauE/SafE family protein [Tessaracoccus sp. SD287]
MSILELLIMVVAGLAIGFSMGTVGGGGAILAVPVLVYAVHQTPLQATTGSLVVVGVTGVLGAWLAWRQRRLDVGQGLVFGAAAVAGSAVGALAAHRVDAAVLMACFAVLMLVTGFTMVRKLVTPPTGAVHESRPVWAEGRFDWAQVAKVAAVASVVGFLTGFLGVGGGFMIVPALTLVLGVPMRKAAGTSLMVIAISCAAALVTRWVSEPSGVQPPWVLVAPLVTFAVVGLLLGAAVAARANNRQLSIGFAVLVCGVALYTSAQALPALF